MGDNHHEEIVHVRVIRVVGSQEYYCIWWEQKGTDLKDSNGGRRMWRSGRDGVGYGGSGGGEGVDKAVH